MTIKSVGGKAVMLLSLMVLGAFSWSMAGGGEKDAALKAVIKGDHRAEEHKARDQYRHPYETLQFFGVKPNMTVVEITPGGKGYYTEILAPYLKNEGKYYALGPNSKTESKYQQRAIKEFAEKFESNPGVYGKVHVTEMSMGGAPQQIAPDGSADLVLTFRNIHNWMGGDTADNMFEGFFRALKPGGVLGVVEHRAAPGEQDPKADNGYVTEAHVIMLAEKAGFKLAEKSEVNANAKDTKNHPNGVWTLPPVLYKTEEQDFDQSQYKAIGESDRMTLKFVKPAN